MRKPDFNLPDLEKLRAGLLAALGKKADAAMLGDMLRLLAKYRTHVMQWELARQQPAEVRAGPFRGMKYVDHSAEGCHLPKLLGCYEHELQPFVEAAIRSGYDEVVNVGCAEGYYAVGLALRLPQATVHAYDIDEGARATCARVAQMNGVEGRLRVARAFTSASFHALAGRHALFFIDIEGSELALLAASPDADLASFDFIIECHDAAPGQVSARLLERLGRTHATRLVANALPPLEPPAWLDRMSHLDQLLAVWEWRAHPTPWLVAASRQRADSALAGAVAS
jgi:hypothetical protein